MKKEQLFREWERLWSEIQRDTEKMPEEGTARISRVFADLPTPEQKMLSGLLAKWVVSADEGKRFDALALIREHELVSCLPALKALAARLVKSKEVGAPYELAKVKSIICLLEKSVRGDRDSAPQK